MNTSRPRLAGGRRPVRLSVEKYEAMVASGAFTKRDRLELIEGNLVEKMTQNPPHSVTVGLCDDVIRVSLPAGWHTRQEKPVRIPERDSMPEPDVSVTRGKRADWLHRHPGPADVALVVEVADSTVEDDRAMALTYGGGGVPVYWLVNVRDRQIEVYSGPSGPSEPARLPPLRRSLHRRCRPTHSRRPRGRAHSRRRPSAAGNVNLRLSKPGSQEQMPGHGQTSPRLFRLSFLITPAADRPRAEAGRSRACSGRLRERRRGRRRASCALLRSARRSPRGLAARAVMLVVGEEPRQVAQPGLGAGGVAAPAVAIGAHHRAGGQNRVAQLMDLGLL